MQSLVSKDAAMQYLSQLGGGGGGGGAMDSSPETQRLVKTVKALREAQPRGTAERHS